MKRADLAEKILDIKREKGWTWKYITEEIAGISPVLVVGALLQTPAPLCDKWVVRATFLQPRYLHTITVIQGN
jgi:hypothetical protein